MPSLDSQNGCQASGAGCQCSGNEGEVRTGREYWRSLDDLADTQEFREFVFREFPAGATEILSSVERRNFLKIMGASLALAGMGMAGCRRWPEQKIAPYASRPIGHAPGTTDNYATSMELGGNASGLLVTSYDHRPIKIEGSPEHPINLGATSAIMQASILDLYDPDRSQHVLHNEKKSDWAAFTKWASQHFATLRQAQGAGLAFLSEATRSPSVLAMKQRVMEMFPQAKWHEYEPLNNDNERRGTILAFGSPHRVHYSFDKAKTIVSLDADFLHCDTRSLKWTRDFASSRRMPSSKENGFQNAKISRLYSFESTLSLTGINSDHRVALRSADVAVIATKIAAAVIPEQSAAFGELAGKPISSSSGNLDEILKHLISDLLHHQGESIVIAGERQPAEVHLIAHLINTALKNVGSTVSFTADPNSIGQRESIQSLATDIDAGSVNTLVAIGGNPAYTAPADLDFANKLSTVETTVHLSDYVDETSQSCNWHVNRAHYLEAWGDGLAEDGTVCLQQPLILPLFDGKSAIELLAAITGDSNAEGYAIVRHTFSQMAGLDAFESKWRKALHDGVVERSAPTTVSPTLAGNVQGHIAALSNRLSPAKGENDFEIVFAADYSVLDGRFANNGWLQELPDPVTRLTWDNAAIISPATATRLSLKTGSMIKINVNGRTMSAAAFVLPGHHEGSITLPLGYGRTMNGRICSGAGFDFYQLRTASAMGIAPGATITKEPGSYELVSVQDHHAIDSVGGKGVQDRLPTLFREASLDEYHHHPDFAKHRTHVVHRLSMFEEDFPFQSEKGRPTAKYAWAMSIDLNACTGCGACVAACQAENNIPIVGKEQVKKGREMHWIRVDRYFKGGTEAMPSGYAVAPVTCMHCENAPCEQVCPVAATVHDSDGLNVMVYNRCVGTRYCSNNCPYKVRRFNYFDYHRRDPHRKQPGMLMQVDPDYYRKGQAKADPIKQMQFNPEVTVRSRGVMEKCTYCVQRISKAKIEAKSKWVKTPEENRPGRVAPIEDGTVVTACAQACPAQAIVFGDLEDPNSKVSQLQRHERSYEMLEEINTKPRTKYMARLRNPAVASNDESKEGHS